MIGVFVEDKRHKRTFELIKERLLLTSVSAPVLSVLGKAAFSLGKHEDQSSGRAAAVLGKFVVDSALDGVDDDDTVKYAVD